MVDKWTEIVLHLLQEEQSACKDGLEIAAFHCIRNRSSCEKRTCFKQWLVASGFLVWKKTVWRHMEKKFKDYDCIVALRLKTILTQWKHVKENRMVFLEGVHTVVLVNEIKTAWDK